MKNKSHVAEKTSAARERVLEDVKAIVAVQADMAVELVHESSDLENDLGFDSLAKVETVLELEDHFDVDVPDDVADEVRTVRDIVDGVMDIMSQGSPRAPAGPATAPRANP